MPKNVLVSGAAGFVGSNFVNYALANTDWNLIAMYGSTYADAPWRLPNDSRVKVISWDLKLPLPTELTGPVDIVVNIASESHVDRSISDPVPFINNNMRLMLTMLEYARVAKPELFLQFSTDEVVGPVIPGQLHKEWAPVIPSNPYAASKAAQEAMAVAYWRTYKLPLVITRCMNIVGEAQNREKFLPMAVSKLVSGQPVGVHAKQHEDGTWESGSRCWTPVDWVSEAVIKLAQRDPYMHQSGAVDKPDMFNIVGEPLSNADLVDKIAAILGVESKITYSDYHSTRPGHDLHYGLDGSKLKQLGITSSVDFDEFLEKIVRSYL